MNARGVMFNLVFESLSFAGEIESIIVIGAVFNLTMK